MDSYTNLCPILAPPMSFGVTSVLSDSISSSVGGDINRLNHCVLVPAPGMFFANFFTFKNFDTLGTQVAPVEVKLALMTCAWTLWQLLNWLFEQLFGTVCQGPRKELWRHQWTKQIKIPVVPWVGTRKHTRHEQAKLMLSYYMLISSEEEKGQIWGDRGLSLQVAICNIIALSKLYIILFII